MFYTNSRSVKRVSVIRDEERMILHDFHDDTSLTASLPNEEKADFDDIQRKVDEIYMFVQPTFMKSKPSFLNNRDESANEKEKKKFTLKYSSLNLKMNSFLLCAINSI